MLSSLRNFGNALFPATIAFNQFITSQNNLGMSSPSIKLLTSLKAFSCFKNALYKSRVQFIVLKIYTKQYNYEHSLHFGFSC